MSERWTRGTRAKQGVAALLFASLFSVGCRKGNAEITKQPPVAPAGTVERAPVQPGSTTVLAGGLREQDYRAFYHLSQGSEFVPYCALEVFASERSQSVAQYFDSYHLIPDVGSDNPLALPIGLTEDKTALHTIGFNCAACHVGKISSDASYIVVGAPGSFNIRQLYDDLIPWLSSMLKHPGSAAAIAKCLVHSPKATKAPAPSSTPQDDEVVQEAHKEKRSPIEIWAMIEGRAGALHLVSAVGKLPYTLPGPGRVDAFMTALNLMNAGAKLKMDSPVSFPQLWGISTLKWLHWDDDTTAALQRNMGQAIGVGAIAPAGGHDHHVIVTSLNVPSLIALEGFVQKIRPPAWPFAKSDPALVRAGGAIFADKCARCHEPLTDGSMPEPSANCADNPNTDPRRLLNFTQEQDATINKNWPGKKLIDVLALQLASAEKASKVPPEQRDKDPKWRITGRYGARTLHGVWATAPYLHNNSVPTLAELLKRPGERTKKFTLDYAHYDVDNIGFKLGESKAVPSENFDTSVAGNDNVGHEFGTELSADDKLKLLSYLKEL